MNTSNSNLYSPSFSHIYVEQDILSAPETVRILSQFPQASVITISHYKDVFCRSGQDYVSQHRSQSLIIAAKHGQKLYPGSPVCQSFDNEYFCYTSCMMNCIYDCEYCYLKGMYQCSHLVYFINTEDIFDEVRDLLAQHPLYLCVSYDTDLVAVEHIFGLASKWCDFVTAINAVSDNKLTIELRTKCGNIDSFKFLKPDEHIVLAFTVSPDFVTRNYEHGTSSMKARIDCASSLLQRGHSVRLCFDPMIYCPDYRTHYADMIDAVHSSLDMTSLRDISVGSFRISKEYMKRMRHIEAGSAVIQFPFENTGGFYHYPDPLQQEMEGFLISQISQYFPTDRIFTWR